MSERHSIFACMQVRDVNDDASIRMAGEDMSARPEPTDRPGRSSAHMEADLRELIATIHNPHLRRLLEVVLGRDSATWPGFRDAPAAKHYHQAYRHGLLEHSLSVAQAV